MGFSTTPTATNPDGWNWGGVSELGGQANWAKAAIAYMDTVIQHCIGLGAQGIIVWDIEGEKGPLIFYGDPRVAATVSPEMNAAGVPGNSDAGIPNNQSVSDFLMTRVRAAGFKTGITTRAQLLNLATNTQTTYSTTLQGVTDLEGKMDYANARWGCTIFYCDSNDVSQPAIFQQIRIDRPQYLVCPEHWGNDNANGLAVSASTENNWVPYGCGFNYLAGLGAGVNVGGTGDILDRSTYPQGFDLVEVANSPSDLNDMTICAKAGDILLFVDWVVYTDTPNVEAALKAAGTFTGTGNFVSNPTPTPTPSPVPTPTPTPRPTPIPTPTPTPISTIKMGGTHILTQLVKGNANLLIAQKAPLSQTSRVNYSKPLGLSGRWF